MRKQKISLLNILCENDKEYLFSFLKSKSLEELKVIAKEFFTKGQINKFKDNEDLIRNILSKMDYYLNIGHVFDDGKEISCLAIEFK